MKKFREMPFVMRWSLSMPTVSLVSVPASGHLHVHTHTHTHTLCFFPPLSVTLCLSHLRDFIVPRPGPSHPPYLSLSIFPSLFSFSLFFCPPLPSLSTSLSLSHSSLS